MNWNDIFSSSIWKWILKFNFLSYILSFSINESTVNFLLENLWKRGYLEKSERSKTYYYEADISLLESLLKKDIDEKEHFLSHTLPELREMNKNVLSKPKMIFFDGIENCKKAYLDVLKGWKEFYEFWAHQDLVDAFGWDFMDLFIKERIRLGIFCSAIATEGPIESLLQSIDTTQLRRLLVTSSWNGKIHSSIIIYSDMILILNLSHIYTGVRIQNRELAETLKTIFLLCTSSIALIDPLKWK